ncbi:hypothetical protein [Streptomyces sp. H39-S7]|uniref:hypothetical protein n=1 Tax=Streptomyces sp. H39-S7 TaxID=3004357 RepID=UPI0022B07D10|nr:hypothetical protein [Streptomyces sp. H39-S7]MCZ4120232.1 hypothetical protein [Streptomyces sp. H39-S7]
MSDVAASVEVVEEVRSVGVSADVLDEQLIGQLVDQPKLGIEPVILGVLSRDTARPTEVTLVRRPPPRTTSE